MKWYDLAILTILFGLLYFSALYQKGQLDELYQMHGELRLEIDYCHERIDQLERINDQTIQLLTKGGWE